MMKNTIRAYVPNFPPAIDALQSIRYVTVAGKAWRDGEPVRICFIPDNKIADLNILMQKFGACIYTW